MSMRFLTPNNGNDPSTERIDLEVLQPLNLSEYAILDRTFDTHGQDSNIHRHIYRFPPSQMRTGDIVRLISGRGDNRITSTNFLGSERRLYIFFWNSDACIWNNQGDTIILLRYTVAERRQLPSIG